MPYIRDIYQTVVSGIAREIIDKLELSKQTLQMSRDDSKMHAKKN
jgi:hypothetical protein